MLFLFVFIYDTTSIVRDKSHMRTLSTSEKHCKCLTATYSQLFKATCFYETSHPEWQAD